VYAAKGLATRETGCVPPEDAFLWPPQKGRPSESWWLFSAVSSQQEGEFEEVGRRPTRPYDLSPDRIGLERTPGR
jgi:hypothetical protein